MKRCRVCGHEKPLEEMLRHGSSRDGRQTKCVACAEEQARAHVSQANRNWREKHPEQARTHKLLNGVRRRAKETPEQRHARVLRRHGLTPDAYAAMKAGQGGVCAICGEDPGRTLHVDHDEASGAIRGLLCGSCNRAIGQLGHDPDRCVSAAMYLARAAALFRRGERF